MVYDGKLQASCDAMHGEGTVQLNNKQPNYITGIRYRSID